MNEGVTITFAVIFLLVALVALVLFKEARTHRFWRQLVAENNLEAITGIMEGEIDRWRTQRPPKGVSAAVWAGVQGMELLTANARYVRITTSAEPEFRVVEGKQTQVATALDTARATGIQILEMVFYDVPNYRPTVVRIDVYTAFRDAAGRTVPTPILSLTADRNDAGYVDWLADPASIVDEFDATFALNESGDTDPIELPEEAEELRAIPVATQPTETPVPQQASDETDATTEDRSAPVG